MSLEQKIDVVMEHYKDLMWPGQDIEAMWRVLVRVGFVSAETDQERQEELDGLPLKKPNGFMMAVSHVGAKYCANADPDCSLCPLRPVCEWETRERERAELKPQSAAHPRELFPAGGETRE